MFNCIGGIAMKKINACIYVLLACTVPASMGCSSSTTPASDQGGVQMYAQMEKNTVTPSLITSPSDNRIASGGLVADSLHIDRIRILVHDVKLHAETDGILFPGHNVRVGPFLITVNSTGATLSASADLPDGKFDQLKLEVHRFSNSEVSAFINDDVYTDFVTGDRYSMIIDGHVYENGTEHVFRYTSAATLNVLMQFDSALTISPTTSAKLTLLIDPTVLFRSGFTVVDPRDPNNRVKIDNNIRFCFHALKRWL